MTSNSTFNISSELKFDHGGKHKKLFKKLSWKRLRRRDRRQRITDIDEFIDDKRE